MWGQNSWLSRNRIGSKLKTDRRLTHRSKHIPHLPILFSLARGNDRVLYLDDIVGPRLSLPATLRDPARITSMVSNVAVTAARISAIRSLLPCGRYERWPYSN